MLLPFLTTSAFVFVYRALHAPPEYIGFVVLGGAMTAFWTNVMWMMAAQLYWEKDQGNLDIYITSPISLMSCSSAWPSAAWWPARCARRSCSSSAPWCTASSSPSTSGSCLFAVFVLTLAALYGLGMMLSSLFLLWGREA